jgi:hypothetical protein
MHAYLHLTQLLKLLKKEKSPTALNNFSPKIKNHSPSPPFEPVTRIFFTNKFKKTKLVIFEVFKKIKKKIMRKEKCAMSQ